MKNRPAYSSPCRTLQIRSLFFFGICLLIVTGFELWLNWRITKEMANSQHGVTAARAADQLLLQVHWQGLDSPDEAWKQPTERLIRQLNKKGVDATFLYRPDAPQYGETQSGHPSDQFETDLIGQFMRPLQEGEKAPAPVTRSSPSNATYYYQPIYAERECLGICHYHPSPGAFVPTSTDHLAVGDLMAVARISLPNASSRDAVTRAWNWLLAADILTALLVMVAFSVVIRYAVVRAADAPRGEGIA
ncbi:MAG: hypothetical protein ACYC6Y_27910 [Thermoguttaceae bacterium]